MSKDDDEIGGEIVDLLSRNGILPPGAKVDSVRVIGMPGRTKGGYPRPALLADLRGLLASAVQKKFELGDIVVLRGWAASTVRFPKLGERCIVTQVLDVPYRGGEVGTPDVGRPYDIAIAFIDPSDGEVLEFLQDSRMYEKVGSVYDPITTTDGEVLPTA